MTFNSQDLKHCSNLIKILTRGEYKLQGIEVLAMSETMRWLSRLEKQIQEELNPSPKIEQVSTDGLKVDAKSKRKNG